MHVVSVPLYVLVTQRSLDLKMHLSNYSRNILYLIWIVEQGRRVAKNCLGQGRFLQIRTQIHNSSMKLNCMEAIQHSSFKNSYLCQIQIILANNGNPQRIQHFYQEKQKKLCFSSYTISSTFTFQRPSNGNNNESRYILLLKTRIRGEYLSTQL